MNPRRKQEQIGLFPSTLATPGAAGIEAIILEARRTRDAAITARLRQGLATLGRAIGVLATTLLTWPERRAQFERLRSLSDRELADVGLTRGDIARVFDPDFQLPQAPVNTNLPAAKPRAA